MGYTTEFEGKISIDKPLDDDTYDLLVGLSNTRRMKRNIEGYGVEGEFYIKGSGFMGQDRDSTVIDYNSPPTTQNETATKVTEQPKETPAEELFQNAGVSFNGYVHGRRSSGYGR